MAMPRRVLSTISSPALIRSGKPCLSFDFGALST